MVAEGEEEELLAFDDETPEGAVTLTTPQVMVTPPSPQREGAVEVVDYEATGAKPKGGIARPSTDSAPEATCEGVKPEDDVRMEQEQEQEHELNVDVEMGQGHKPTDAPTAKTSHSMERELNNVPAGKQPEGAKPDDMEVENPNAAPVFDPAILIVPEGADWDEAAELAASKADLPMELPAIVRHARVKPKSIFFSGMRRCWVGQSTIDGAFVRMKDAPLVELIQGRTMAERYQAWVRVSGEHPEAKMSFAIDQELLRKALELMLKQIPVGTENVEGARNGLHHWIEVAANQERRERRELLRRREEEAKKQRDQDRAKERHQRLHGRNAAILPVGEGDNANTSANADKKRSNFPAFMRALEPIEEEIDSLEKATGHFKVQLGELAEKPLVKEAKRGQAFLWPARHSDPISVSSCCLKCGQDAHGPGEECTFYSNGKERKLKRAAELPEEIRAQEDDNVYVAMYLAGQTEAASYRCTYELCSERSAHLTAACPTLHARCATCQFRGHRADTKVEGKLVCTKQGKAKDRHFTYRTTGLLGVAFEKAADMGRYTRHRKAFPAAGYYPCIGRVEEALLANIGYEVVFRVCASRTQAYLDGCRKAAKDAFAGYLVQEVVGTKYEMSREEEMAEYDELVTAYSRAYSGVKERAQRKADLRVLQEEELVRVMGRAKDSRDLTRASAHLAKVRADIGTLAARWIELVTSDATVITGIEPINRATAIGRLTPAVRRIYESQELEKAAIAAAKTKGVSPGASEQVPSYAGATSRRLTPSATYTPTAAATRSLQSRSAPLTGPSRVSALARIGPSPERKRSKRQEMAAALIEAYRAHERHEAGGAMPTEAVTGILSVTEFNQLTRTGHELFEHLDSPRFYTQKGQLPKLTDRDFERLPKSMKRVPCGGAWKDTDFRHGELWQIANRWFYIRNAYGELVFDPQNPRLPEVVRRPQRRDGERQGGRDDRYRGRSGGDRRGSSGGSRDRRRR